MAGRGTVRERGNGNWELTVALGMGPDGKQIRKYRTVTATTKKDAEKLLAKFVTEIEAGLVGEGEQTKLKDFIEIWFKDYGEQNLAPKSIARYKQLTERITKSLGHIRLGKLKPNHLLKFYANLQEPGVRADSNKEKGLSERTILHHHRFLHSILETACQWQYITLNPASRVRSPKVRDHQAICYDEKQVSLMLNALKNEPLVCQLAVWLTLATGLRQGELMGLRWQDIDLKKRTICVNQVRQYVNKQTIIREPKTAKSKRLLSVPITVIKLMVKFKKHQATNQLQLANKYQKSEYLLTKDSGEELYPNFMSNWFPDFLKRHNLPHMNFHGLRHTSATLLITDGFNAIDVSRRLGNARPSTTSDIYAHAFMKADENAANVMDEIFKNITSKKA